MDAGLPEKFPKTFITVSKNVIKTQIFNLFIYLNLYLTDKGTKKRFSVFSLMNLIKCAKYKQIYKLMPATHLKKMLGQRHVYHWVTSPFLLITLCNRFGTEYINCCK